MNIVFLALILFAYYNLWFLIATVKSRNDLVDLAWGPAFFISGWSAYLLSGHSTTSLLVNLLVTFWGLRLFYHIQKRIRGSKEDHRYGEMKKNWQRVKLNSYFKVFLFQMFLVLIIGSPVFYISFKRPEFNLLMILGVSIWLFGFVFEAVADYQLRKFLRSKNKKGIMKKGLWSISRHPNYFGEVVQWWGIFIVSLLSGAPLWLAVSPFLITFLILKVSGVPLLEERLKEREGYLEYVENTPVFLPFIGKKGSF